LVSIPQDKTGWDGLQFDDPKTDSGILILFRMAECEKENFTIPIKRITSHKEYSFELVLGTGKVYDQDGSLTGELKNKPDAMLVYYSRLLTKLS
jgi:hypothetical protein